jgi:hypothetical protein
MRRLTVYGLAAAGLVVVAALAGLLSGARAFAQSAIKAVWVKVVDEPGRTPYQVAASFAGNNSTGDPAGFCQQPPAPPACFLTFPPVPAGKRLVVEHIAGQVRVDAPSFANFLAFRVAPGSGPNIVFHLPLVLLPGVIGSTYSYGISAPVKYYVEPLNSPSIQVTGSGNPGSVVFGASQ